MILKQQIPDIIALEIDLLLAKFCSFIIFMFVNAFCAVRGWLFSAAAAGFIKMLISILKSLNGGWLRWDLWCAFERRLFFYSLAVSQPFVSALIEFCSRWIYWNFSGKKHKVSIVAQLRCVQGNDYINTEWIMLSAVRPFETIKRQCLALEVM